MTSEAIRTASNATLRSIYAGLVREASDRFSRSIAVGEMERRGLLKARF